MGENRLIFALDPNLKMDTETLVLHHGQKFLSFVVHFYKKFLFWYQTGIVPEKGYATILPILEVSPINIYINQHSNLVLQLNAENVKLILNGI